jgi:2-methylcitrate dehydratase PrpD
MSHKPTESKRLLSHIIAEWACPLKYEHLSREAIQAAKLFWFDTIGCALGGSQQDDARILLKHYRAMGGGNGGAAAFAGPVVRSLSLPATGTFWSARRLQNQMS